MMPRVYERTAMSMAGPRSDDGSGEMPDPAGPDIPPLAAPSRVVRRSCSA